MPLNYTRTGKIIPTMGWIQRIVGFALGLLFVLAVFVFTSLVLGILLAVGLLLWGWLWWRGRSLPQHGTTIEGEFRDVTATQRIEQQRRERDKP